MDKQLIDIDVFKSICSQSTRIEDYPLASRVVQNILIYEGSTFLSALEDPDQERHLKSELGSALKNGPGIFIVKGAYPDTTVIDRCTALFRKIVLDEKAAGKGHGDHFGNNERIWNSLQKVCHRDPDLFVDYYANPVLAIASEAWLGPYYQASAQMNNVKPGSDTQLVHRDYHLGFQSAQTVACFPSHAQIMSQFLTLQGAVAHGDMPLESGPTLFLPYSQLYEAGYLAYGLPEFQAFFSENRVQIPFSKGDMVFFSPAVFHAAGKNASDKDRIANLLQISSAFGRTMENVSNSAMVEAVYPVLLGRVKAGTITEREIHDSIAVAADGYSFPTNLDSDPPVGGNAPETGQQLMFRALSDKWPPAQFREAMKAYIQRREAIPRINNP